MNKIVNTVLLAGDKFIPELHLRWAGFTYNTCGRFTRLVLLMMHHILILWYYALAKRINSNKILKDRAYDIATNPKYDGYQRGLASTANRFFEKITKSEATSKVGENVNEVLAQELQTQWLTKSKEVKSMQGLILV